MNEQAIETYRQHALLMHLTDDELVEQMEGRLAGIVALRVAAHLERCLVCEGRLEFLRSMTATNVITFSEGPMALGEALNDASFELDHVLAKAAYTSSQKHFEDAGGWFECRMFERDDGTMSVSISSHVTEEAGAHVDLLCDQVPDWRRTATFELEGDEIVARVVLTIDDRRQLPKGCRLRCQLRYPDGKSSV